MNYKTNQTVIEMDVFDQELQDFFVDVFAINPVPVRFLPSAARPFYVAGYTGFRASEIAVAQGGYISGGGFTDLYTPEIREFEQTALVGLGGMVI